MCPLLYYPIFSLCVSPMFWMDGSVFGVLFRDEEVKRLVSARFVKNAIMCYEHITLNTVTYLQVVFIYAMYVN
jgi:hypothetical protein